MITYEDVKKLGACKYTLDWFKKHFPNGGKTKEILKVAKEIDGMNFIIWYIKRAKLTEKQVDRALNHKNSDIRCNVIKYQELNKMQIEHALSDKIGWVRCIVIEYHKLNEMQIERALSDKDWRAVRNTIQYQNLTRAQKKGVESGYYDVKICITSWEDEKYIFLNLKEYL